MNQLSILLTAALIGVSAWAAPAEKLSLEIRRNATTPSVVTDYLAKNYYTSGSQCSQYENVQVPYQDTEYYTESVPYTDYVTEYRSEERCEPEIRRICHIEQDCSNSGGGRVCEQVRECDPSNPNQCKTREVCHDRPGTRVCRDREVCVNTPVPGGRCRTIQVPYERAVTRYREETRTRTVTKYRYEQRCVDYSSTSQFDHQASYDVVVNFPSNARLTGSQKEVLKIRLVSSDEYNPRVALEPISSIHNYRIRNQTVISNQIRVDLEVIGSGGGTTPPVVNPPVITPPSTGLTKMTSADLASLKSASNVSASLVGLASASSLVIADATREFSDVTTSYAIYVDAIGADGKEKPLNMKSFTRTQLKVSGMAVKISAIIGSAKAQANLKSGSRISITLVVKRAGQSPILAGKSLKVEKIIKFNVK